MLQRGLPAVLQWAPALNTAGCHLQQAAQQITSACSTSGRSDSSSIGGFASCLQPRRSFKSGLVVDVRRQPRRPKTTYFNPDDGPEAYQYWKDLWAAPRPPPKPKRPRRLPVYLEPDEQAALLQAAEQAGVPHLLAHGRYMHSKHRRRVPRLIAAVTASGGRIPSQPAALAARIAALFDLQRQVPGLDVLRIFKANGFGILSVSPKRVLHQVTYLGKKLSAAGVAAEPGLLLSAAVKPALRYPVGLVIRAQELPAAFQSVLGVAAPKGLMQHPFRASILNRTTTAAEKHMRAMAARHGKEAAAAMYSRLPQLLLYRTALLRHKTRGLGEGLGLDPAAAESLVRRNPRLLTYSVDKVQRKLKGLQRVLGMNSQAQLAAAVLRWPSLLHKAPKSIAAKIDVIQQQLAIPERSEAVQLLRKMPFLASYSQAALKQPLKQLQRIPESSLLAPLREKAVEVLRAKPWLLALGSVSDDPRNSLTARLQLLGKLAELGPEWRERVQQLAASSSEDVAVVLAHEGFVERIEWLLLQCGEAGQSAPAPAAAAEGVGLYGLVVMREPRFEKRFPGFTAQKQERAAAREAAQLAVQKAAGHDDGSS